MVNTSKWASFEGSILCVANDCLVTRDLDGISSKSTTKELKRLELEMINVGGDTNVGGEELD